METCEVDNHAVATQSGCYARIFFLKFILHIKILEAKSSLNASGGNTPCC